MRTSSGQIPGRASSFSAACGNTPDGASTRCSPTGLDDTRPPSGSGKILLKLRNDENSSGVLLDLGEVLSLSSHETVSPLKPPGGPVTDLISPELAVPEPSDDHLAGQPYAYQRAELVEPDWTRIPG